MAVAEAARDHLKLDVVLWVPNNVPPHKKLAPGASTENRIEMTKRAIEGNDAFELSRIEVDRDGPSYMVDTLRHLKGENPDTSYWLIIGRDSLDSFPSWREPDEIVSMARLAVYPRHGSTTDGDKTGPFDHAVDSIPAPRIELSSTNLRHRIQSGQSIRYLVPNSVFRYIADNDLYRPGGYRQSR